MRRVYREPEAGAFDYGHKIALRRSDGVLAVRKIGGRLQNLPRGEGVAPSSVRRRYGRPAPAREQFAFRLAPMPRSVPRTHTIVPVMGTTLSFIGLSPMCREAGMQRFLGRCVRYHT